MDNSFKQVLDQAKSIIIMLPTKPYFDQVAAGLSLYLVLREQYDVQVYSPSPMTVEFNRLIGVNKIASELGNKNLIIRFTDYKASDIERVSYDIENGQFKLTVIPKPKINPPGKEQVDLAYSGISSDTVILIGGANDSHFPAISQKELSNANLVHIGTRDISLSSGKNYISLSKPASSESEIVTNLIKESALKLNEDSATNLLMGIENATDNFTDSSVSAETFALIADLMRAGGRRTSMQGAARGSDFPPGSIPQNSTSSQSGQSAAQQSAQSTNQQVRDMQNAQQQKTSDNQQSSGKNQVKQDNQDNKQKNDKDNGGEEPPKDWLSPKIYKGTSVS